MTDEPSAPESGSPAGRGQRLAGHIFEVALFAVTLGAGWVVWFLRTARSGQTPAKAILGLRVVGPDGLPPSLWRMVARDIGLKVLVFVLLDVLLLSMEVEGGVDLAFAGVAAWLVAAAWCVWDGERQCLWDKVVGTRVVMA